MDTKIFRNSYVIFVISFIVFYLIFYLTGYGYTVDMVEGRPVRRTSWKYPLGLSLIMWVFWHYYLYPVNDDIELDLFKMKGGNPKPAHNTTPNVQKIPSDQFDPTNFNKNTLIQKINMNNWT